MTTPPSQLGHIDEKYDIEEPYPGGNAPKKLALSAFPSANAGPSPSTEMPPDLPVPPNFAVTRPKVYNVGQFTRKIDQARNLFTSSRSPSVFRMPSGTQMENAEAWYGKEKEKEKEREREREKEKEETHSFNHDSIIVLPRAGMPYPKLPRRPVKGLMRTPGYHDDETPRISTSSVIHPQGWI